MLPGFKIPIKSEKITDFSIFVKKNFNRFFLIFFGGFPGPRGVKRPARRMRSLGALAMGAARVAVSVLVLVLVVVPGGWVAACPRAHGSPWVPMGPKGPKGPNLSPFPKDKWPQNSQPQGAGGPKNRNLYKNVQIQV